MDKTNTNNLPYVKLVLGPSLILSEMICGGFFIENLKITKQATNKSYPQIINKFYNINGIGMFYRGFYPWGILQCIKGLPILFTQDKTYTIMKNNNILNNNRQREIFSGIIGGISQALLITPLQRMRTIVLTNDNIKKMNTSLLMRDKIKTNGINTLFKGLTPTIIKKGSDWGMRFGISGYIHQYYKNKYNTETLTINQNIISGIGAGFCGSLLTPLDVIVSQHQKDNQKYSGIKLVKIIYLKTGIKGFYKGFILKAIEGSYHTMWMIGVGNIIFNYFKS